MRADRHAVRRTLCAPALPRWRVIAPNFGDHDCVPLGLFVGSSCAHGARQSWRTPLSGFHALSRPSKDLHSDAFERNRAAWRSTEAARELQAPAYGRRAATAAFVLIAATAFHWLVIGG